MRGRLGMMALLAMSAIAVTSGVLLTPSPAFAASIKIDPDRGPAGSSFTVYFGGFTPNDKCPIAVRWNSPRGLVLGTASGLAESLTVAVPDGAAVGGHAVYAIQPTCKNEAKNTFEVTVRPSPRPSPTKSTSPSPSPSVTRPPVTPTPDEPGDPNEPDDPASPTPTLSATPSPTPSTSASPGPTDAPLPSGGGGALVLDRPNVRPGEPLTATGSGCTPNAPVVLTSGIDQVGTATADGTGAFVAPVQFTRLEPGRRTITADCGVVLTTHVDLIVSSSTSGQAGTAVVLIFFVLVGIALLRWQYRSIRG